MAGFIRGSLSLVRANALKNATYDMKWMKPASLMHAYTTVNKSRIPVETLRIEKSAALKPKPQLDGLAFGTKFSDHMLEIDWTEAEGWKDPRITPYHNLSIDPACSCLHYGLELFEGLKAYRSPKGEVLLFRPDKNMERMNNSAARLALPTFDGEDLIHCISELIKLDQQWIPERPGYSLYIRPTMIATQNVLGVSASKSAKLFAILSPVGPYFPEGFTAVKLYAQTKYQRAFPGGTGNAKIGGNYAPTIIAQIEAQKKGCSQVMWLYSDKRYITEVGTMNVFFLWINEKGEKELVTSPLDGTILPGVTRGSILELSRQWGEFKVTEKLFTIDDVIKAINEKRMLECFGAGTACIVAPVKGFLLDEKNYEIPLDPKDPNSKIGPLTKRFADTLMDIQYGRVEHPWSHRVC